MDFVFHDGGRVAAGCKGKTGDCVTVQSRSQRERPIRRSMTPSTNLRKQSA
jgi:hypothetical protein